MTPDQVKRKLAAILSADVKGYSRLMEEEEEGTIRTLKAYLEVISGFIQQHRGRVVGTAGDNILAEFASVVDAVRCAVGIQEELKERNKDLAENRRMEFRIGINLGDVVEEGDNILGDGVNIAARIQGLAEAGGIWINGTAYDQIENKIPLQYDYLGEHEVKNIAKPVRIYRVQVESESASLKEAAYKEKMAFPLPDKPSIAVLPFINLSGDKRQEYFCEGLAEGIIDGLSKSENLFVIARNSSFTYKGKAVKVKQVAEEMGVRYVMEGSVQRGGNRVRITVQLIDALSGGHLFSERYDRDLKDPLDLQDEIIMKVLNEVLVKLTLGEEGRLHRKGTNNLEAYLKVLQAREYSAGARNKERLGKARQLYEEAIALDPKYAVAYSGLASFQRNLVSIGASESPRESIKQAFELSKKALALDDSNSNIHVGLAFDYGFMGELGRCLSEAQKAVSLNPNSAYAYHVLGWCLNFLGRPQEAIPFLQKSLRLSPIPINSNVLEALAFSYILTERYEDSISTLKKELQIFGPDTLLAHIYLIRTYIKMGLEKEARAEGAEVLRIDPNFKIDRYVKGIYRDDRLINELHKAGLK